MVFNSGALIVLIAGGIIWMAVVTALVIRMIRHYNRLTMGMSNIGLRDVLETMIGSDKEIKRRVADIEQAIAASNEEGKLHFQHLGIVRFNPFLDTGGSQSFSLALLDAKDNGIVITSLYARTGNRWYVKQIRAGKGKELELSKEEENAVKKARLVDNLE